MIVWRRFLEHVEIKLKSYINFDPLLSMISTTLYQGPPNWNVRLFTPTIKLVFENGKGAIITTLSYLFLSSLFTVFNFLTI